jgi:hypothetical protein
MTDSLSKKGTNRPEEETAKKNASANIGLEKDEQMMNGMYGMAETKEEDQLPSKIDDSY